MLEFTLKKYKASVMLEESIVPPLGVATKNKVGDETPVKDCNGLYLGYGKRSSCYPYRDQNLYIEPIYQDVNVAILENDYLYAEFLVDFGARLWVLKNKITGQDLLYTNDVIKFRNLSIRNAWFSGGVEWNVGVMGHSVHNCDRLYTAKAVGANNEEVLRFYEFERVREVYYQMDFWLDKDKLIARVRIENPNSEVTPMYWWSTIASPEFENGRIIVPANSAYTNNDGKGMAKAEMPINKDGIDLSFYENIMDMSEYYYDIDKKSNKYIANIDKDGKGLLEISARLLEGRKLFCWGHTQGGLHWQRLLTGHAGDYVEIQAGLTKTQCECIPMPPKSVYEWVEVFTDITVPKSAQSGEYSELIRIIDEKVKDKMSSEILDALRDKTGNDIALRKGEVVFKGSGYGYLKNLVEGNAPKHLIFSPCQESKAYEDLVIYGEYSKALSGQVAFAGEKYLIKMLTDCVLKQSDNWNVYYQLAVYYAFEQDYVIAEEYCKTSMILDNNYFNNHLMTIISHNTNAKNYMNFARKTVTLCGDNFSVAESIMKLFVDSGKYSDAIEIYKMLDGEVAMNERLRMYLSMCYLRLNDVDRAEEILLENGGLSLIDYREGDKFLNALYKGIRVAKYGERMENIIVPTQFDFVVVKDYQQ